MAEDMLSNKERAALLALMAQARTVSNPELKRVVGFSLDGKERVRLNERKLVTSQIVGRSYAHELTENGWRWCAEELAAERPARAGYLGSACYLLLANLRRFLDHQQLALADVFRQAGAPADGDLAGQIRAAYARVAREPGGWVSLADLRPLLDAPRTDVDEALRRLNRTRQVTLIPEDNQKALSAEERAAAVRLGGEDKHLISIEDA